MDPIEVIQPTVVDAPVLTIPGVRILLANGQTLDLPLVQSLGEVGPSFAELSNQLRAPQMDFPFSRVSLNTTHIALITMIDMAVTQQGAPAQAPESPSVVEDGSISEGDHF